MIPGPALPTKVHALLTILGEGTVFFLMCLIGAVYPWFGKPISTRRYIAISGLFTAVWVLVAAVFAVRG
jgi:hypothetical protein